MNIRMLIEKQEKKFQDKVFLYFEGNEITYENFNIKVNKIANAFKRLETKKNQMAAIMLPNSPVFLYVWMALNKLGAIEVPINTRFKESEVKYILQHSEASLIVIHEDYYPVFSKIKKKDIPKLKNIIFYGKQSLPDKCISFSSLLNENEELDIVNISDEDPAVCIYTSGTTDQPKGVLHSHKNMVLTGEAYAYTVGITSKDRVMTSNPLFHINAQIYPTMGSFVTGASLILLKRFSSSKIFDQARLYRATKMILVQAVMPWIWSCPQKMNDRNNPVETVVAGNIPAEIYRDFEQRFQIKIQTIYSLTEAPFAIMGPMEGKQVRKPGGIGVPMEHPNPKILNEIKLIDENGHEIAHGKRGEIIIKNPAIMIGYFKNSTSTAETVKDGWIHTGDIGYQDDDGYLFFVGRKKEVIRRRGELVSPLEIESIINAHSCVKESAVIGVPSELGTGEEEIKAYVILKRGKSATEKNIITWCSSKLADFKIPYSIEFRTDFPKSAIGRIQKNFLK